MGLMVSCRVPMMKKELNNNDRDKTGFNKMKVSTRLSAIKILTTTLEVSFVRLRSAFKYF